jgi:hypothetical protein
MARTAITAASIRSLPSQGVNVAPGDADLALEPGDDVDGNETPCTGSDLLIVSNTDASPQTVDITAAPDAFGRTGAITAYSVAAGAVAVFGPFPTQGWKQTDGMLHIDVADAAVEIGILRV